MQLNPSAFIAGPELIHALLMRAIEISCGKDHLLFRQGGAPVGLYILNKGEAVLTMTSPAGESVMSIQTAPGSVLGLPGLVSNEPYTMTAIARCGAELSFVTRDDFMALMQADPLLPLKILPVLAAELRSARHAISNPDVSPANSAATPSN
ncbi:MAG: cyclic nucleotide-binding domain-containing protein [Terracidiphilus sp.]